MKNTKSKQLVLEILGSANTAHSAPEILAKSNGTCDKVTVYRVLERLEHEGIIHKIVNFDGVTRYAMCAGGCVAEHHHDNHLHFSCTNCGKVECLEVQVPKVRVADGYLVREVAMNLKGLCPDCHGN